MGEISQFRHMLGLDTQVTSQGGPGGLGGQGQAHATSIPPLPQNKARTMKDSKEIMKKRRERAICIVSTVLNIFFTSMLHVACLFKMQCFVLVSYVFILIGNSLAGAEYLQAWDSDQYFCTIIAQ